MASKLSMSGTGTVLAPGMAAPVASLPPGKTIITIESAVGENDGLLDKDGKPAVSENLMVRCVYPDGFAKSHQVAKPEDLAPRVTGILRGRYGVTGEIKIIKLPALKAGETIEVEI